MPENFERLRAAVMRFLALHHLAFRALAFGLVIAALIASGEWSAVEDQTNENPQILKLLPGNNG